MKGEGLLGSGAGRDREKDPSRHQCQDVRSLTISGRGRLPSLLALQLLLEVTTGPLLFRWSLLRPTFCSQFACLARRRVQPCRDSLLEAMLRSEERRVGHESCA